MTTRRLLFLLPFLCLAACGPKADKVDQPAIVEPAPVSAAVGDICSALIAKESLQKAPSVPVTDPVIRILAFGDYGEQPSRTADPQRLLAGAMAAYHSDHPFDFGITLGDNFYPRGLSSVDDPRWTRQWERLYSPLGIRIYAVLGNHDYYDSASPAAERERSRHSATWCLPRNSYTFTAGPVQLFAIDTTPVDEPRYDRAGAMAAQRAWLDQALAASNAPWKVVYGHHPIYTTGEHGNRQGVLTRMRDYLLPVLKKHQVDVYLAGHDHDLEALQPEDGIHFIISGAAGRYLRRFESSRCRLWGAEGTFGFTVLEAAAGGSVLTVSFVGLDPKQPYKVLWGPVEIRKGASSSCRAG